MNNLYAHSFLLDENNNKMRVASGLTGTYIGITGDVCHAGPTVECLSFLHDRCTPTSYVFVILRIVIPESIVFVA
jgi:hypothetical protein